MIYVVNHFVDSIHPRTADCYWVPYQGSQCSVEESPNLYGMDYRFSEQG